MRLQKSGGPSDWEELREKLGGRTVFVSVDSISANSGIPHKMVAFRHFLQEHPEYINKVVFVQAAITDSTVRFTASAILHSEGVSNCRDHLRSEIRSAAWKAR